MREAFACDDYQVMLAANKSRTGFDQPLLVAIYANRQLSGVIAMQTLSRHTGIAPQWIGMQGSYDLWVELQKPRPLVLPLAS